MTGWEEVIVSVFNAIAAVSILGIVLLVRECASAFIRESREELHKTLTRVDSVVFDVSPGRTLKLSRSGSRDVTFTPSSATVTTPSSYYESSTAGDDEENSMSP